MTTLTIVRHGQTDWNTECRFQGSSDMELNDTGIAQAEARVQFPREWKSICTRQLFLAPPEGESVFQVGFRVQEGLCSLYENYQNKKILLVCHGFVSRTITGLLNHLPDEDFYEFRLGNCDSMSFIL